MFRVPVPLQLPVLNECFEQILFNFAPLLCSCDDFSLLTLFLFFFVFVVYFFFFLLVFLVFDIFTI